MRPLRLVQMQLKPAAAASREEFATGSEPPAPPAVEMTAGMMEYEARRCFVCGCRYPCFGFGPPLRSKGTIWACGTHRAEVDRQLRNAGSYSRATPAGQPRDAPLQHSLFSSLGGTGSPTQNDKMVTQDAETGEPLSRGETIKGYEFSKNRYVIVTDDDLDSVRVESSGLMTIEKFVTAESIDPIYYDASHYLTPDGKAGEDVYAVLREAISRTGRVALTRVVIGQRERILALRPMGDGLAAHALNEQRDLNEATAPVRAYGPFEERPGDGSTGHSADRPADGEL